MQLYWPKWFTWMVYKTKDISTAGSALISAIKAQDLVSQGIMGNNITFRWFNHALLLQVVTQSSRHTPNVYVEIWLKMWSTPKVPCATSTYVFLLSNNASRKWCIYNPNLTPNPDFAIYILCKSWKKVALSSSHPYFDVANYLVSSYCSHFMQYCTILRTQGQNVTWRSKNVICFSGPFRLFRENWGDELF